jgi:hypothetical protein
MVDADSSASSFFTRLFLLLMGIGLIALVVDFVLRIDSKRPYQPHQDLDEINYRYRRRR